MNDAAHAAHAMLHEPDVRSCLITAGVDLSMCPSASDAQELVDWLEREANQNQQRLNVVDKMIQKNKQSNNQSNNDNIAKLEDRARNLYEACEVLRSISQTITEMPSDDSNHIDQAIDGLAPLEHEIANELDRLNEADAQLHYARSQQASAAEAAMIRKMMSKQKKQSVNLAALEAKASELEAASSIYGEMLHSISQSLPASALYADMLTSLSHDEERAADRLLAEQRAAEAKLRSKLASKKRNSSVMSSRPNTAQSVLSHDRSNLSSRPTTAQSIGHSKSPSIMTDDLLTSMLEAESKRALRLGGHQAHSEDELKRKLAMGKKKRVSTIAPVSDLDNTKRETPQLTREFVTFAQQHLGLNERQITLMSTHQLQSEFAKKGIDVDVDAMLKEAADRSLSQSVAAKRAADQAELDLLKRLMKKRGATLQGSEKADADAREVSLRMAIDQSDSMLARLHDEQSKRLGKQSSAEELAQQRMQEKLARGRKRVTESQQQQGSRQLSDNPQLIGSLLASIAYHLKLDDGMILTGTSSSEMAQLSQILADRGLDFDFAAMFQALTAAEAALALSKRRAADEAELQMLRKLLARLSTGPVERAELETREIALLINIALWDDLLRQLLDEERKRWAIMTAEEREAHEQMRLRLSRRKKRGTANEELLDESEQDVLQRAVTSLPPSSVDQAVKSDEQSANQASNDSDADLAALLAELAQSEAARAVASKKASDEAELAFLRKLMRKKSSAMSSTEKSALEARDSALVNAVHAADAMLAEMAEAAANQLKRRSQEEVEQEKQFLEKLKRGKRRSVVAQSVTTGPEESEERAVQPSVSQSLDQLVGDNSAVSTAVTQLALQHLGKSIEELASMTVAEVASQLAQRGVQVDMAELLREVADAEAVRQMTAQRAADAAELDFVRRLTKKRGHKLSEAEREALEEREAALNRSIMQADSMLAQLAVNAQRHHSVTNSAALSADEAMREKLARGKKGRKSNQTDSHLVTQLSSESMSQPELVASVLDTLSAHLDLDVSSLASMSAADIQAEVDRRGLDIDVESMMRSVSDNAAARALAAQRLANEAELKMIRKLLARKAISEAERTALLAKEKAMEDSIALADDLIDNMIDHEQKRWDLLNSEQQRASEEMAAKIANQRRRRADRAQTPITADTMPSESVLVSQVAQQIVQQHLPEIDPSVLASMTLTEIQDALEAKGLVIDLTELMRGLADTEAGKALAAKCAADQAELDFIRKLLRKQNAKFNAAERADLEAREKALQAALAAGQAALVQLVDDEAARQAAVFEAEEMARQQLMEKLKRGKSKNAKQSSQPASVAENMPLLASILASVAEHLDVDAESLAGVSFEELQTRLAEKGIDIDIVSLLRGLTDDEAARRLAAQRAAAEAELRMIRKMLARNDLSAAERNELLAKENALEASLALMDAMLEALLNEQKKRWAHMSEEERIANEEMLAKLKRGRRSRPQVQPLLASEITSNSAMHDSPALLNIVSPLAEHHLGISADVLASMTVAEVAAGLKNAGVDIDLLGMLRELTDGEAGRDLAAKRAAAAAELDLIRRMLKRGKMNPNEADVLREREHELEDECNMYDALLARLAEEARRRNGAMSAAEQQAYDAMMAKLAKRKQRKQEHANKAPIDSDAIDADAPIDANPAIFDILLPLAQAHLPLSETEIGVMTLNELSAALAEQGVDIDLMGMLKGLTDSEAARILAARRAAMQAEVDLLRKLLANNRKLSPQQRSEIEQRIEQLDKAIENYDDVLNKLMQEELGKIQKQREARDKAEQDMLDRLSRKKVKSQSGEMLHVDQNPTLMTALLAIVAEQLHIDASSLAGVPLEELQDELAKRGIDIDLVSMLRGLTDDEAARRLAAQRAAAEAELRMIRKMLAHKDLSAAERNELLAKENALEASLALMDAMLEALLNEQKKGWAHMSEEERIANEEMLARLKRGKRARPSSDTLIPITAISEKSQLCDAPALLNAIIPLVEHHLGLTPDEVASMTVCELAASLKNAGVEIDLLGLLRELADGEAGRALAARRAAAAAELDLIRRMLKRGQVSPTETAALLEREKELVDECNMYDALLARLAEEARRRNGAMSAAEQQAYDAMMAKLAKRKQLKHPVDSLTVSESVDGLDTNAPLSECLPVLDMLLPLAQAHLLLSEGEVADMSLNELQAALAEQGVDIDLLGMLKGLTDSEAARILAARRAAMQAEVDLLRKLLATRKLTPEQQHEIEQRIEQLDKAIENYDALLNKLMEEQLRKIQRQREAKERADQDMLDRLNRGKKKPAPQLNNAVPVGSSRHRAQARADAEHVFDRLVPSYLTKCPNCGRVHNIRHHQTCVSCSTQLPAPSMQNNELRHYHRSLHHCNVSPVLVDAVLAVTGPCVRDNFVDALELLAIGCLRCTDFIAALNMFRDPITLVVDEHNLVHVQTICANPSRSAWEAQTHVADVWDFM